MRQAVPAVTRAATVTRRAAGRLADGLETALGLLAAVILMAMLALVMAGVCLRYVFHTGVIGMEDLGIWLNIGLISAGLPLTFSGPLSMRFDGLAKRLSGRASGMLRVVADGVSVVAGLILLVGGIGASLGLGGMSPTLGLPEWVRFTFPAFGGLGLLALLCLRRLERSAGWPLLLALIFGGVVYGAVGRLAIDAGLPASLPLVVAASLGLLAGAPLAHVFLASSYIAIAFGALQTEQAIIVNSVAGMSKFLLLAIPFFLLAGAFLKLSGAAGKLVTFAASLVGHYRGGLAQTTLLTGVLFSGASGSSVANAAFSASTFHPELVRHGYPPARAGALVAASSVLDNVIPPSIAFLILATATNLPVGALLVGGLFAGLLMAAFLAVAIRFAMAAASGGPPASATMRKRAGIAALPAFGLGLIVVFGIRLGIVTTTEAAALAAMYALILAVLSRRSGGSLVAAFRQSAAEAAAIGLLIGAAAPVAFLLAVDDIAGVVSQAAMMLGGGAVAVLLLANAILLLAGLVMDIGAAILLFGPVLLPVAISAGIDPIRFGVILVVNLMIGGLTPPVGMLVFVVGGVTGLSPETLFRAMRPFLLAHVAALFVLSVLAVVF
ncbi:TRAP transporter large permease [Martelella soudanensis]|uniref:TRAP transporter large permease n=1 Tax=unclassified Martelella TaxID=2629616 RepID=UPI0015DDCCCF|nr:MULTISPECIES: TRAP transporter large permease subunit [unclassified Martelella]